MGWEFKYRKKKTKKLTQTNWKVFAEGHPLANLPFILEATGTTS